jgi:chromosomal replication initiation ATPase DnaA
MTERQLVLDLGYRTAFDRDDFLVTTSNCEAVSWIDNPVAWPGHALAIYGPAGCGKTHLVHVFALHTGARILAAKDVLPADIAAIVDGHAAFALEDGENVADERAFLHLFNGIKERGARLLIASRNAPGRWPVKLPDLKSRLASVQAIRISAPDDAMIEALLVKLFADRQLTVGPDVVGYLVRHMDRSFATARQVVARADAASLAGKRPVTIPLIKPLIEGS